MMRPVTVHAARERCRMPPVITYTRNGGVHLAWTDGTPTSLTDLTTWGNAANEVGYRIERAPVAANGKVGAYTQIGTTLANVTSFDDTVAGSTALYSYRVVAWNAAGNSVSMPVLAGPSRGARPGCADHADGDAPGRAAGQPDLAGQRHQRDRLRRSNEPPSSSGVPGTFRQWRPHRRGATPGNVTYVDKSVRPDTSYTYRVKAVNGAGSSGYSNTSGVVLPPLLAAPTGLIGTAARQGGGERVTLAWTGVAGVTGYTIQWSTSSTFATVAGSAPVGSTATTFTTGTIARQAWYFRIGSVNSRRNQLVRTRLSGGRPLAVTEMQTVGSAPADPTVMLGAASSVAPAR